MAARASAQLVQWNFTPDVSTTFQHAGTRAFDDVPFSLPASRIAICINTCLELSDVLNCNLYSVGLGRGNYQKENVAKKMFHCPLHCPLGRGVLV